MIATSLHFSLHCITLKLKHRLIRTEEYIFLHADPVRSWARQLAYLALLKNEERRKSKEKIGEKGGCVSVHSLVSSPDKTIGWVLFYSAHVNF